MKRYCDQNGYDKLFEMVKYIISIIPMLMMAFLNKNCEP